MLKKVKDAVRCSECGAIKEPEIEDIFCDVCGSFVPIKEQNYIPRMRIVYEKENVDGTYKDEKIDFCSWRCFLDYMKNFEPDDEIWYVDLPDICGNKMLREFREEISRK